MTIAISLKVNDAIVLAADSATTFFASNPAPGGPPLISKVYTHADKISNLYKGLPIGMITWGSASIGTAAIATLAKDLRKRLSGDPLHPWALSPDNYTIRAVAERVHEFMYEELYVPAFQGWAEKPDLGFIVAGFSGGETMAEEWEIEINSPAGNCNGPVEVRPKDNTGWVARGQPEAVGRVIIGFQPEHLTDYMTRHLPTGTDVAALVDGYRNETEVYLVNPAMPLQDAIDLAIYMVEVVEGFHRFQSGAATVGGAVDVAAITKHEGFKWIQRKHYYPSELNPPSGT